jgi:hypothetical protein
MAGGIDAAATRVTREIGKLVVRTARQYAPKSPTRAVLNRLRKTKGRTRRNPRATSRPVPGGLERSIAFEAAPAWVDVYVGANSEAGKYAAFIHDGGPNGSGQWRTPGPGTVAKGPSAGDKFIERAINDKMQEIDNIVTFEMDKAMGVT